MGAKAEDRLYAVAGLPVTGAGSTGRDGAVTLSPKGLDAAAVARGVDVPVEVALPNGTYVMTVQLVSGQARVDAPQAFPFVVGPGAPVDPVPADPTAPAPTAPEAPPPTAPEAPASEAPVPGEPVPGEPVSAEPVSAEPVPGAPVPTTPSASVSPVDSVNPVGPAPGTSPDTPSPAAPGDAVPTVPSAPVPGVESVSPVDVAPVAPASEAPAPAAPAPVAPATVTPVPTAPSGPDDCTTRTFPATQSFGVTSISPACGRLSGHDLVTLRGSRIPADVSVYVGGQQASVMSTTPTGITISTPPRASAGTVDVRVVGRTAYDVIPGAFTYLEADGSMPAPDPVAPVPAAESVDPAPVAPTPLAPAPVDATDSAPAPGPSASTAPAPDPGFEGLTLVDNGGQVEGFEADSFGVAAICPSTCTGVRR